MAISILASKSGFNYLIPELELTNCSCKYSLVYYPSHVRGLMFDVW